jgi:hypothetical protein
MKADPQRISLARHLRDYRRARDWIIKTLPQCPDGSKQRRDLERQLAESRRELRTFAKVLKALRTHSLVNTVYQSLQ